MRSSLNSIGAIQDKRPCNGDEAVPNGDWGRGLWKETDKFKAALEQIEAETAKLSQVAKNGGSAAPKG